MLVTGGAGAVGHAAIQLAVWAGARVITTVSSPEKADLARAAGAHHVVNYRTEDVASAVRALVPGGVDLVVDVDIARKRRPSSRRSPPNGTIAAYATADLTEVTLPVMPLMAKNVAVQFVLTYTVADERKRDAVAGVSHALADGALRVGAEHGLPITRFALADTARRARRGGGGRRRQGAHRRRRAENDRAVENNLNRRHGTPWRATTLFSSRALGDDVPGFVGKTERQPPRLGGSKCMASWPEVSSARMTWTTALMSARCVNACGKLPRCRPVRGSISSAYRFRVLA